MDFFLWGIMKDELFKPGKVYETRDQLVTSIMELESQFNDPNHRLHQALENAFLGSYTNDYGRRRRGKILKLTFDKTFLESIGIKFESNHCFFASETIFRCFG